MMDMYSLFSQNVHSYTLTTVGLRRNRSRCFSSRAAAQDYMYKLCDKLGLCISEVWNDNHDKTYRCTKGVDIHINRQY